MEKLFSITTLVPAAIVLALIIAVFAVRSYLKKEEKLRKNNAALRKEILEHGLEAEATVVNSRVCGTAHNGDTRSAIAGKFKIKILKTGEEYDYRRKWLAVPMTSIDQLKHGNVIPVYVHSSERDLILFEFDKVSPALSITFRDP